MCPKIRCDGHCRIFLKTKQSQTSNFAKFDVSPFGCERKLVQSTVPSRNKQGSSRGSCRSTVAHRSTPYPERRLLWRLPGTKGQSYLCWKATTVRPMFKQVIGGHLMFLLDNIMLQMLLQATQQLVRATNQRSRASFRPNPFLLQAHSLLLHQSEPQPKPEEPLPPQVAESHPSRAMAQFPYLFLHN